MAQNTSSAVMAQRHEPHDSLEDFPTPRLFSQTRPSVVLQFTERVVLHKGTLSADGSTATAYCWVVWRRPFDEDRPTVLEWIPPCRKRLERAGDYEARV